MANPSRSRWSSGPSASDRVNGTLIAQIVTSGPGDRSDLHAHHRVWAWTLLFGILRVVNFVHGELVMLSAFAVYFLSAEAGLPFFVAAAGSLIAISAALAVFCQHALFKPLRNTKLS